MQLVPSAFQKIRGQKYPGSLILQSNLSNPAVWSVQLVPDSPDPHCPILERDCSRTPLVYLHQEAEGTTLLLQSLGVRSTDYPGVFHFRVTCSLREVPEDTRPFPVPFCQRRVLPVPVHVPCVQTACQAIGRQEWNFP